MSAIFLKIEEPRAKASKGWALWTLGFRPFYLLAALQAANVAVLALGSRVPQIVLNVRRGDAGLLSATSCALNVAGNAARAFTTLVLTRDALLLAGALTQGALNGVLLWQALATRRARKLMAVAGAGAGGGGGGATVVAQPAAAAVMMPQSAAAAAQQQQEEEGAAAAEAEQPQQRGAVFPAANGGGGSSAAAVFAAG